jgi:hypothetical protein
MLTEVGAADGIAASRCGISERLGAAQPAAMDVGKTTATKKSGRKGDSMPLNDVLHRSEAHDAR